MKNALASSLVAVASSVLAQTSAHADTIFACQLKATGTIRIVSATTECSRFETKISWNSEGVPGPRGPAGAAGPPGSTLNLVCPPDSVKVGAICVDRYEASVWQIPVTNTELIGKIRNGSVTAADLSGLSPQTYLTYACDQGGQACNAVGQSMHEYAVSVPGVLPAVILTWFQAQQFCLASGKRLLTSAEWQAAAAGTPDGVTGSCVVNSSHVEATGGAAACVSTAGAFDMVGNVWEWVTDWVPVANACENEGLFGTGNTNCMKIDPGQIAQPLGGPAALLRGGGFNDVAAAGPFAVLGTVQPWRTYNSFGFRCAR